MKHDSIFRPATLREGSESLREFAHNAGMDNPDREYLLDDRDVWVKNPFYRGEPGLHPEDDREDYVAPDYVLPNQVPVVPPITRPAIDDDIPF